MRSGQRILLGAIWLLFTASLAPAARGGDYLTGGEVAAIGGGTAAVFVIANRVNKFDSTRSIYWQQPTSLERSLQYALGGTYYPGKTNFLDGRTGSAITPVATSLLLLGSDLAYPQGDKSKNLLQNQFLFVTGIAATKAVTGLTKGLFRRPRPMLSLEPALAAQRSEIDFRYDHQSFVSGHASSAFFAMTFLNLRTRAIMRSEMSAEAYRTWRWVPPVVCFSWASYVGWSRVSIFKHYVTDIAAGALTGWLLAELFATFADPHSPGGAGDNRTSQAPVFFRLSFPL